MLLTSEREVYEREHTLSRRQESSRDDVTSDWTNQSDRRVSTTGEESPWNQRVSGGREGENIASDDGRTFVELLYPPAPHEGV